MRNKSFCNPGPRPPAIRRKSLLAACIAAGIVLCAPQANAGGDAPPWMHASVNVPLPAYDEKTRKEN